MQTVSANVRALLASYAKVTLTAYLNGAKLNAGIGACELTASCGDDTSFSFGNACAARVNMTLAASMPGIKEQNLRITWAVDGTEYPLFDGKVENAVVTAGRTSVEAWDAMYYGGSDAFIPAWQMQQDINASAAFSLIASEIGVSADPAVLDLLYGITITGGLRHLPEDTSCSAVAGYIAGLIGGNAIIDRSGQLTVRQMTQTDFETEPYAGGASAQNENYSITGITLQREEMVTIRNEDGTTAEQEQLLEYFSGDGTLMVSNPLADQDAADRVYEVLNGISFRPGTYSFPGGLLLEPGDLFAVHSMDGSYSVAAIALSMSFDGGVKTTVSCGGFLPEGGSQGPINQALATLVADFARLRMLVAENAQIVSARISHLTSEDITAGKIHSTDFSTEELQELYPSSHLYPSNTSFPNNGEQIIRGFEIDFETGVIRGVFWSEAMASLEERVTMLETQLSYAEKDLSDLSEVNADLQQQLSEIENEIESNRNDISDMESLLTDLQIAGQERNERLSKLENALLYPKSL